MKRFLPLTLVLLIGCHEHRCKQSEPAAPVKPPAKPAPEPYEPDQGVYGKSTRGQDLKWYRVGNAGPKVLITACIHGNEPYSEKTVSAFMEKLRKDPPKNRRVYIVPIVSPDSYPNSREVDGVDPNRNWDAAQPITPIKALQDFFLKMNFQAAMSCHTGAGGGWFYPYGNKNDLCPDDAAYQQMFKDMSATQQQPYYTKRACEMYGHPIHGSELDWYYAHGAIALVTELKTKNDVDNIYDAFKVFIDQAPQLKSKQRSSESLTGETLTPEDSMIQTDTVNNVAKELKTQIHVHYTAEPETTGQSWCVSIDAKDQNYNPVFGHANTAEQALLNALTRYIKHQKATIDNLTPKNQVKEAVAA